MPGKFEIMRAVQKGLDSIPIPAGAGNKKWTRAAKTELCKIGRGFGCYVCASGVDEEAKPDHGEWLYDVTWLEYGRNNGPLVDVTLVGECEWAGQTLSSGDSLKYRDAHDDDFEKLLLARGGVRLMIFQGSNEDASRKIAKRLAKRIREFNGSRAEDAWLLVAWEWNRTAEKGEKDWLFRYFTVEANRAIPFKQPSGDGSSSSFGVAA